MNEPKYLAITGGVGGAKLALGLSKLLAPEQLAFVVNTGDDFLHLGLHISPDIDTLIYTLADENNPETGWGRRDEQWHFMQALNELGGDAWFQLGDKDLALHIKRANALAEGRTLSEITAKLAVSFGIGHPILPMSDDSVRTIVHTDTGKMAFQTYFVREKCQPAVTGFEFSGAGQSVPNPAIDIWLDDPALAGIIICPSNPYVSIDPILSLPGLRERLQQCTAPVIAVSPVVGGAAIKGPTVKMMQELSIPNTATAVAAHYRDFLQGFVLDREDEKLQMEIQSLGMRTAVTNTVMISLEDRIQLAQTCLDLIVKLT